VSRLRRSASNIAAFLSLALFLAGLALWLRSHHVADEYKRVRVTKTGSVIHASSHTLTSSGGYLSCAARKLAIDGDADRFPWYVEYFGQGRGWRTWPPALLDLHDFHEARPFRGVHIGRFGFTTSHETVIPGVTSGKCLITVPHWALAALAAVLPALRAAHFFRRRSRRRRGLCPICSYDLRATPNRCPECGRPAT
jgi:hypothetical protein